MQFSLPFAVLLLEILKIEDLKTTNRDHKILQNKAVDILFNCIS